MKEVERRVGFRSKVLFRSTLFYPVQRCVCIQLLDSIINPFRWDVLGTVLGAGAAVPGTLELCCAVLFEVSLLLLETMPGHSTGPFACCACDCPFFFCGNQGRNPLQVAGDGNASEGNSDMAARYKVRREFFEQDPRNRTLLLHHPGAFFCVVSKELKSGSNI